ncbi:MAG: hypothetical protein KDC53_19210 [Saprospiraceae bacterium]|nr:hypothetical protein [Saprospiraceae bacterium]
MNDLRYFILISFISFLLFSCQKENGGVIDIHPKFQIYVDRFIEEAALRGKIIDFSDTGLKIEFRNAVDVETGGVCRGNHHIEIEKFYWEDLTDADKEGLIFHELGHCELNRRHRNDTLSNGEWASRMRGSPIPEGLSAVINYSGDRRKYYIDELFDETISEPSWASYRPDYYEIKDSPRSEVFYSDSTTTSFRKDFILDREDNFEIELEVDAFQTISYVGIQFGSSIFDSSFRIVYTAFGKVVIDSGKNLYGTMRDIDRSSAVTSGYNKITLRKINDRFIVYINEQFIYWFDVPEFYTRVVESFKSREGDAHFRNLTINKLDL